MVRKSGKKMATSELCKFLCKFEVKEELDHYIKEKGWSRRYAARVLAEQLTELLGEEVSPETLRTKSKRAVGSNEPNDPTPENHTESEGNQTNQTPKKKAKDGTYRGGKRKGAGKKRLWFRQGTEGKVTKEFEEAIENVKGIILDAKHSNWQKMEPESIFYHLGIIYNIIAC